MNIEQRLVNAVEKMPAFPKSVQRIIELSRDINVEAKAIVEVLEKDPVMAARILKVINSAFYGLPRQVSSVGHAVVMLGMNTVKNMALTIAAVGMLPSSNQAGFNTEIYLRHSLVVAGLARLLAQKLGGADSNEAYIAGLLHDFGKVVFAVYMPEEFTQVLTLAKSDALHLHQAEQHVFGIDHTLAGAMLVDKWQFPKALGDCIGKHHQPPEAGSMLLRCLFLADQLARFDENGKLYPGSVLPDFPEQLANRLGDGWDAMLENLPERVRIVQEAQAFAH